MISDKFMRPVHTIFLIDDDNIHQQVARIMLERQAVAEYIHSFLHAGAAINSIKENMGQSENLPDIILLDLNMPVMNGWDFLNEFEQIKAQLPKAIKIFILTSSASNMDRERSANYNTVNGYLIKPLTKESIRALY